MSSDHIVVPETTARAMFPINRRVRDDRMTGDLMPIEPTVHWVTSPTELVCEACKGFGRRLDHDASAEDEPQVWHDCTDCDGTGRPTVKIMGQSPGDHHGTPHGSLVIGEGVPILDEVNPLIEHIYVANGFAWHYTPDDDWATPITDAISDQPLEGWAYPILETST